MPSYVTFAGRVRRSWPRSSAPAAATTPAEALARRIEERQRGVPDLVARFTQTYRSGPLGRDVVERGASHQAAGPDALGVRDPEKKTFVSDGKTLLLLRARRQAGDRPRAGPGAKPARAAPLGQGRASSRVRVSLEPRPGGRLSACGSSPAQARSRGRAGLPRGGRRATASARSRSWTPRATAAASTSTTSARTSASPTDSSASRCRGASR